jgi:hypothetical protein
MLKISLPYVTVASYYCIDIINVATYMPYYTCKPAIYKITIYKKLDCIARNGTNLTMVQLHLLLTKFFSVLRST